MHNSTNVHVHNSKEPPERNVSSLTVNPNQAVAVRAPDPNRRITRETALRPPQRDSSGFKVPSVSLTQHNRLSVGFWVIEGFILMLPCGLCALGYLDHNQVIIAPRPPPRRLKCCRSCRCCFCLPRAAALSELISHRSALQKHAGDVGSWL